MKDLIKFVIAVLLISVFVRIGEDIHRIADKYAPEQVKHESHPDSLLLNGIRVK
jgi:hypothetical protein